MSQERKRERERERERDKKEEDNDHIPSDHYGQLTQCWMSKVIQLIKWLFISDPNCYQEAKGFRRRG